MLDIAGLNPWVSMWNQPRSAIRAIAYRKPAYGVFYLSAIYALQCFFFYANWWSLGLTPLGPFYLGLGVMLSPFLGFVWLYVMGAILSLTGRLFRGRASMAHLRSAMAWSSIPYSIALLMWLILFSVGPEPVFIHDYGMAPSIFVNLIGLIVGFWSFILLVQSVREVQSFSLIRSLLNVFLTYMLYGILFFFSFLFLHYFI